MSRRTAWTTIGEKNSAEVSSASEMMRLAGLDWTVTLNSVYTSGLFDPINIDNRYATVRTNKDGSESVLSVVGGRYKVFQNSEIFSNLDTIVGNGHAKYAAAGELGGGKVVWTVLELPEDIKVGDDQHQGYIVARTSHDGSSPFQMTAIINRLSCTNQINATMMNGRRNGNYYSLRHTTNNDFSTADIFAQLSLMKDDIATYTNVSQWLRGYNMDNNEFINFIQAVYPMPSKFEIADKNLLSAGEKRSMTRILSNRSKALQVWNNETGTQENIYGTRFGAFQAVVEANDHLAKRTDKQAEKILLGTDGATKMRALSLLGVGV